MKLFKKCTAVMVLAFITSIIINVGTASAHDAAYFDSIKTPNGGQIRMAGPYHFELVLAKDSKTAKENAIGVHVTDHAGKALSTIGATAVLTIVQGKNKTSVTLTPDGENHFSGKALYASSKNFVGALTVMLAGKPAEQARFTPFSLVKKAVEKKADEHKHEHEHHH